MSVLTPLCLLPPTAERPTELCATLYFERAQAAAQVRDKLARAVGGWVEAQFVNPGGRPWMQAYQAAGPVADFQAVHLLTFSSPVSQHTQVVQLLVSSTAAIGVAWPGAADWLYNALYPFLHPAVDDPLGLLGYSLVYCADEADEPAPTSEPTEGLTGLPEALAAIRSIQHYEPERSGRGVLAEQALGPSGRLLLIAYPDAPLGGLLYLALRRRQPDCQAFADRLFASPAARLPHLDVFVHKALLQYLTLNLGYDHYAADQLVPFRTEANTLLGWVDAPGRDMRRLRDFSQKLATFSQTSWDLSRVELSLSQQLVGLQRQATREELPLIHHLYQANLEAYAQEIQALTKQHQLTLEHARAALALVETQESRYAAREQRRFGETIALCGIFFGAYTTFDKDLLTALHVALAGQQPLRLALSATLVAVMGLVYEGWYKRRHS